VRGHEPGECVPQRLVMEPTVRLQMISERNDAAQHREPFAWFDFFP
jgi:hypothetical protein